eukprot:1251677-Amphidinium_carterae.1
MSLYLLQQDFEALLELESRRLRPAPTSRDLQDAVNRLDLASTNWSCTLPAWAEASVQDYSCDEKDYNCNSQ